MNEAKQGFIYIAKNDVLVNLDSKNQDYSGNRKILLNKGEIVEFRYNSPCYFRTIDDKWFFINEKEWSNNFVEIAQILENVRWKNLANTEEIWRLQLFKWTNLEFYLLLKKELEREK